MKVLIISPFFPYSKVAHAGGKFTYDIIKSISKRHEIHLLSRIEPDQFEFVGEMNKFCKHIDIYPFTTPKKTNLLSNISIIASYLSLGLKANRLMKCKSFDIVQVEHVETALLIGKRSNPPMILDAHDVIMKPARRRYLASKGVLSKGLNYVIWKLSIKAEEYITEKFDLIFTRSRHDKQLLLKLNRGLSVVVVPHPVSDITLPLNHKRESKTLLFAGAMHRDVNADSVLYFYHQVLPIIRQEMQDVKFYIVGNNPNQKVKDLQRRDKDVIVTGFVEKLEPYFLRSSAFVSPLFIGGGIIAKNLQAMSLGLPVVTTSIGNEGIEAIPDKDILIADDPHAFAYKVLLLLKDSLKWKEIAQNGRMFVIEKFSLESVVRKVEGSYKRLL